MDTLDSLIDLSHEFGADRDYVIAGGGNTSFKTRDKIWVKASGTYLSDIDREGFVLLSREKLGEMGSKAYSEDPLVRESEVKNDLRAATITPGHLRPSVETSLHNLIGYAYIVHTHPTLVNAVMCSRHAEREVRERFGDEALYVEYTDPGYVLFIKLQDRIGKYHERHLMDPKIIFLQNHGVFVAADSAEEIRAIYSSIEARIKAGRDLALPDDQQEQYTSAATREVAGFFEHRGWMTIGYSSDLIRYFTADRSRFKKVSRPFTPDIIVYCKSNYLFLEKGWEGKQIRHELEKFHQVHEYFPKVILEEGGGLIIVEENEPCARTVLEVFTDMMKISFLSEQFGGPHPMSDEQIRVIDNWEAEHYRRSVARNLGKA